MDKSDYFFVSYEIASGQPGAPAFEVHLIVDPQTQQLTGQGRVTNGSSEPPLIIHSRLQGDYTTMTILPNETQILAVLGGHFSGLNTSQETTIHNASPNIRLRMVLDANWKWGMTNYSYCDPNGIWQEVANVQAHELGTI